ETFRRRCCRAVASSGGVSVVYLTMGHFCRICRCIRPNEKFSGRGHRDHVCKDCQRMPAQKRDGIERLDELWNYLNQSTISEKNVARLKGLRGHANPKVQILASLLLDIARIHP